MRKFLFITATFVCFSAIYGQKKEVIKINNSFIAITLEANSVASTIGTKDGEHGDSKYYPAKTYSNGTKYIRGEGEGFSAGTNFEFYFSKNTRSSFLSLGVLFMQHGAGMFSTQGGSNPNDPYSIFWDFYPRSTDPEVEIKMTSVRVPLSLNAYFLTFGRNKNNSVGINFGGYADYILSAKAGDKNIDEAFNKFYFSGFAGVKFKFGRLYAHGEFSLIHSGKLYSKDYAFYADDDTGNYKESFQTLGIGFYLKK